MTAAADASRPDHPLHVLGALALELRGDAPVARAALAQADAGELAAHIARDLAAFAPQAAQLQLVTVGAHYDPVELLRPGWALHRELDQLSARAPKEVPLGGAPKEVPLGDAPKEVPLGAGDVPPPPRAGEGWGGGGEAGEGGRIVAFGAHEGQLPGVLAPSPDYFGGPLRLVPFVLGGDPAIAAGVGDRFERELIERGMAGAATALAAQDAFGMQIEHARYLTAHDLAAMTALQYEHAGLAPLWPVLETALLEPDGEAWLDTPPEPLVHYAGGEARIALFEPRAWKQRYANDEPCDTPECRAKLERQHQHFQARQRQIAAVLAAHGIAVNFVHCTEAETPL